MLDLLSKDNDKWYYMAFSICKNEDYAKDLVQDMYLKMYQSNKKYEEINDWYIYTTILNLFRNQVKKQKTINIEDINYLQIQARDKDILEARKMMNDLLQEHLDLPDVEVLLYTHEMSLRKCEQETGASYQWFHRRGKAAMEKLKNILQDLNIEL
jgi:DNA-directed RNA polymerase specialized sigma24 family protein